MLSKVASSSRSVAAAGPRLGPPGLRIPARSLSSFQRPSSVALGKRPAHVGQSQTLRQLRYMSALGPSGVTSTGGNPPSLSHSGLTEEAASTSATLDSGVPSHVASTGSASTNSALGSDSVTQSAADLSAAPASVTDHSLSLSELVAMNPEVPLKQLLRSPEAIHATCSRVDLASIGLDHSIFNPAGWVRDALVTLHDIVPLPWAGTILLLAAAIRLCVFGPFIKHTKRTAKMREMAPQLTPMQKEVEIAKNSGDQEAMVFAVKRLQAFWSAHDVHPAGLLKFPLIQAPLTICTFMAVRKLASHPLPSLEEGGMLWFTDLTQADPYYVILPAIAVGLTNVVMRLGADGMGATAAEGLSRHFKNIFAMASPIMVLFMTQFPAALLVYWMSANLMSISQALLLRTAAARRYFLLPTSPPASEPTFKESRDYVLKSFRDVYKERADEATKRQAILRQNEAQLGLRRGTSLMERERIKERKK